MSHRAFPLPAWGHGRVALAALLGSAALPTVAATHTAASEQQEIIVTAPLLLRGVQPERELGPDAIESYGVSTIDELLGNLEDELGATDEEPLIFVNGKQINDTSEIGALPVEALDNVQVLPRGSAVRVGGSPGQRVINISLKRNFRSATLTAAHKISTDGDWHADRGEAILTKIHGQTRVNVALRVRNESSLLESQRGIVQPQPPLPYALSGNVVGYPNVGSEVDALLSSLAGQAVTVAAVPVAPNPTLADFVAGANNPAATDLGQFRSLRPSTRNIDLNAGVNTELSPWLTANATVDLQQNISRGVRGLPSALFVLSPTNPSSPFPESVGLAFYGRDPLRYRATQRSGSANLTFDATFGEWTGNLHLLHTEAKDVYDNDEQTGFGFIPLTDSVDPFATDLSSLIAVATSRTTSKALTSSADLSLTGPSLTLPAGPVQTTVEGKIDSDRLRSHSSFSDFPNSSVSRTGESIRGALDIPIASSDARVLPGIGKLNATVEYALAHFSDAGTEARYALGLNWAPSDRLQFGATVTHAEAPASILLLGSPVIVTPDVRVFDPLTGQTVDVSLITGGNPSLRPETDGMFRLNTLYVLLPRLNLQLNAEYTLTRRTNFISVLPEASAAVMLAFPGRFVRDADGTLISEDLRPVNFQSDRESRLRWGLSMNTRLGGNRAAAGPRTFFQLTVNHTMVFSDKIVIRAGLDPIDLLGGGAIGIAGGRLRHQVDANAAITSGGTGARLTLTWRGASELQSQMGNSADVLHFSPVLLLNARLFTDLRRYFPHSGWARGLRLSLDGINLTNQRQRVADSFGNTPLQYQPAYRDALGRTIEIELRKLF